MSAVGLGPNEGRFPPLPPKPIYPMTTDGSRAEEPISRETLQTVFDAFEKREEALLMRIAALSFHPKNSLQAMDKNPEPTQDLNSHVDHSDSNALEQCDSVLGIKLLQRLDLLQTENEDLAIRLNEITRSTSLAHLKALEAEIEGVYSRLIQTHINSLLHSTRP